MRRSRPAFREDTPGLNANAVVPLGTASVHNIDMASAYCTIAAQGQQTAWHTVEEVKTPDGGTRYKARPKETRVFRKDVMADATYALQQVVESGTGTEARKLDRPAAGKTGTAALRPDTTTSAWFVGFTPQLCAAVDFYKGTGKADLDGVGGLSTFFGGAISGAHLDGIHDSGDGRQEGRGVPAAGRRRQDTEPQADARHRRRRRRQRSNADTDPTTPTPTPTPTATTPTTDADRHDHDLAARSGARRR